MKSKRRFIPLVFLGAIILSLLVIVPAFSASGTVRFYDVNDDKDEDQEWTRQGGMVHIEVKDSDLDVVAKFEGDSAYSKTLSGDKNNSTLTMFRSRTETDDGFVNRKDVTVVDANGDELAVYRASIDGQVELTADHTGTVMVSYWGAVKN